MTLPTIVTAHTFCAFRAFPRGTRTRGLTLIYFRNALSRHWLLRFLDTLEVKTPNVMDRKRKRNGRFISTKSKRKEFLSNLVACSMRSDRGKRREGREREKNEEKMERKSIFHTTTISSLVNDI